MAVKVKILLIVIILSFHSCSREETSIVPEPVIIKEKYQIEITSDYKLKKVTFSSSDESRNYFQDYFYYKDSVITKSYYQAVPSITVYFLNDNGIADSCILKSNSGYSPATKYFFSHDSVGYLLSVRYAYVPGSQKYEYTDTYEYRNGNLTKVTFDPKKPFIQTGKYASYTYTDLLNLIDLNGSFLGKMNKNLVKTYYVGGTMNDVAPCSKYEYKMNSLGLVETKTILSCSSNKVRTIISFEYIIGD